MSEQIPRRPKPGESEEELLRQMQDFEEGKSSIAKGNCVSFQKQKKPSRFAQQRAAAKAQVPSEKIENVSSQSVLKSTIKEKDFDYDKFIAQMQKKRSTSEPFPSVMKLDSVFTPTEGKSLFAMQMKGCTAADPINVTPKLGKSVLSDKDWKEIHEENLAFLASKSKEELIKERDDLMNSIDPSILKFLMKKKAPKRHNEPMQVDDKASEEMPVKAKRLPIDEKYAKMGKYEPEKMEWMEDAESKSERPVNFSARFDFNGNLLPYESDEIEANAGLHHHGDEPHRPGYTLDELMTLARSSNTQQATIAMQVMANVIKNERHGRFIGCFDHVSLLNELLDADLISVVRVSLDNHHSDMILDASVQVLAEILYIELEENALDFNFFQSTFNGYLQPSLYAKLSEDKDFKEEAEELQDVQVTKADLILGLLRTDIVDRFCYLLEAKKPQSANTITNMLKIMIRFARHSLSVAADLIKHDNLLPLIYAFFLPLKSMHEPVGQSLYNAPLHYALKFVRLLMSWGRNIAKGMLKNHDLGSRILCYLSIEPEMSKTVQESLRLIVEAGRAWIVCLRYGLGVDLFVQYHPILMRHIIFFNNSLSMTDDEKASKFNYHFGVVILELINAAICCAPSDEEEFKLEDKKAMNLLEWTELVSLLEGLEKCLKKWCVEAARLKNLVPFSLDLLTSVFSLYSSFFQRASKSGFFEQVSFLKQLESIVDFVLPQLSSAQFLQDVMAKLCNESFFQLKELKDGRSRDPMNLPSLGIIGDLNGRGQVIMKEDSPFVPVATILEFFNAAKRCNSSLDTKNLMSCILGKTHAYLDLIVLNSAPDFQGSRSNWFCRAEVNFVHHLIQSILMFKPQINNEVVVRASLTLLTHYQLSDSIRAKFLMDHVVFHQDFIGESLLASVLETTKIDNNDEHVNDPINLLHLKNIYLKHIFKTEQDCQETKVLWTRQAFSLPSLVLNNHGETLLPGDWQYLPLLSMLSNAKNDLASELEVDIVKSCLIWVKIMNVCTIIKSATFCYSRLATVFLAASDLFLDQGVKWWINQCLIDILKSGRSLVFKDKGIPGIDSFQEFYKELAQQFQAVSYGDSLFALMLLIPTLKGNDMKLRSTLWIDHQEALRSVTLRKEDLLEPLKAEDFTDLVKNKDLTLAHAKVLMNGTVNEKRNPLLYQISIQNIKAACDHDEKLKQELSTQLKTRNISID